jgi:DNA-binding CsgD family transcriptional regulator
MGSLAGRPQRARGRPVNAHASPRATTAGRYSLLVLTVANELTALECQVWASLELGFEAIAERIGAKTEIVQSAYDSLLCKLAVDDPTEAIALRDAIDGLTDGEHEVLARFNLPRAEIAAQLAVTEDVVKFRQVNIQAKLGLGTRAEAFRLSQVVRGLMAPAISDADTIALRQPRLDFTPGGDAAIGDGEARFELGELWPQQIEHLQEIVARPLGLPAWPHTGEEFDGKAILASISSLQHRTLYFWLEPDSGLGFFIQSKELKLLARGVLDESAREQWASVLAEYRRRLRATS